MFDAEFNGTALDTTVWGYRELNTGTYCTYVANPLVEANGYLRISLYSYGATNYCGMISTTQTFTHTYGYFEASIRYQYQPGFVCAFWLQSPTIGQTIGNPQASGVEYDIFEHWIDPATTYDTNLHWNGYTTGIEQTNGLYYSSQTALTDGNFHRYGMAWTPSGVTFYLDGMPTLSIPASTAPVSNVPEYIILDGSIGDATTRPTGGSYGALGSASNGYMDVQYVKVYPYASSLQSTTLAPVANTYVKSGTSASTAFGGSTILDVKSDAASYNANSLLMFDLSGVVGKVQQATLFLQPTNTASPNTYTYADYIADNTWTETGTTWANQPVMSTTLSTGLNYSPSYLTNFDVTAVATAGKKLSVGITSDTPTGSGSDVQYASSHASTGQPQLVVLASGGLTFSSSLLSFGSQIAGMPSSTSQSVTVVNTGSASVTFTGIAASGPFSETNNCQPTLAAGATCSVSVVYSPQTVGPSTGVLTLSDNDPGSPQTISLTGTAIAGVPQAILSASSLSFGSQNVGTSSLTQNVQLSNPGTGTLTGISVTVGGANASSFGLSSACGPTLTPGTSCAMAITFTPAVAGSLAGSITIADNAAGSPQTVALSGTGVAVPPSFSASFVPATLTVKSGQSGDAELSIVSSGGFAGSISLLCGSLPIAVSCTLSAPTVQLAANHTLVVPIHVSTATSAAELQRLPGQPRSVLFAVTAFLLPGMLLIPSRKRKRLPLHIILMLVVAGVVCGCSGSTNASTTDTPPGTYSVSVVLQSGSSVSQSSALTLTVTP
jgi:beta-glucanase (GH16 family)